MKISGKLFTNTEGDIQCVADTNKAKVPMKNKDINQPQDTSESFDDDTESPFPRNDHYHTSSTNGDKEY